MRRTGGEVPDQTGPSRLTRLAGYLALLFGAVGLFAGISGAATFIPLRGADHLTMTSAIELTVVAAAGAAASAVGMLAGWGVLRARGWGLWASLAAALGILESVAALAAVMPSTASSPVPGGARPEVLLAATATAYGALILLLAFGQVIEGARRPAPLSG
jgi:hypothetical protein